MEERVNFLSDSTVLLYYEYGTSKGFDETAYSSESLLVTFAVRTKISLAG